MVVTTNGMVAGMALHLKEMRTMIYDHALIHHILEEAEGERVHLFLIMHERKPELAFRLALSVYQVFYFNLYMLGCVLSKETSHRYKAIRGRSGV